MDGRLIVHTDASGGLMRLPFQFLRQRMLREALRQSEVEARLRGPVQHDKDIEIQLPDTAGPPLSEEEEIRYRRLLARLHYGKETAIPEYEALLTEGEKEYLDAYAIQQRWSKLWLDQNGCKLNNYSV